MVRRYEILILAVSEITQDETKDLESSLEKLIAKEKGSMISFERWGKYRLAYPVNNNDYGVYFLMRFEIAPRSVLLDDLKAMLSVKFNDIVMRHMISLLDKDEPAVYQRPRSLEEGPLNREIPSLFGDSPRGDHHHRGGDRDRGDRGDRGGHYSHSRSNDSQEM